MTTRKIPTFTRPGVTVSSGLNREWAYHVAHRIQVGDVIPDHGSVVGVSVLGDRVEFRFTETPVLVCSVDEPVFAFSAV